MTDIVLNDITSGYNVTKINYNFSVIEDAVNNNLLHRSGGNNVMSQPLDMNGHLILNIDTDTNNPDSLATMADIDTKIEDYNVLTNTGDIIYSSSGTVQARLPIGTTGRVLKVVGGVPQWSDEAAGGVGEAPIDGAAYGRRDALWTDLNTVYLQLNAVSAYAGTLLDDADAATARSTLELVKTTSNTDTTAGRVTRVGDFGIGLTGMSIGGDVNAIRTNGNYVFANTATNTPIPGQFFSASYTDGQVLCQQLWAVNPRAWIRSLNLDGISWSPWVEVAKTNSPAFTGVPTAPTAATGTSTTQIASTAFVQAAGFGANHTWSDLTGSRAESTNYTNSTGRPIQVNINSASTTGSATVTILSITVDGVVAAYCPSYTANTTQGGFASVTVPNGSVYSATISNGNIGKWVELR